MITLSLGPNGGEASEGHDALLKSVRYVRFRPRRSVPRHVHAGWGVAVPLEGLLVEESSRYGARHAVPGEALVIPPDEPHRNGAGRRGCRHLLIETGPDRVVPPQEHLAPGVQRLRPEASEAVRELHALVHDRASAAHGGSEEEIDPTDALGTAIAEVGLLLLGATSPADAATSDPRPSWLGAVRERVVEEPARAPTLAELAALAGVHPSTVLRRFRAVYGVTPAGLARRRRLEEAAHRLSATDDDISRLAHELGFADQSHLTRAFRDRFGVTPAAYRRILTSTRRRE